MRRVRELRDGLTNLMSGAGTAADKRAHGVYALRHADPAQIEAAYRSSWLMRKVVDLPPQDETRAWRRWQAGPAEIAAIEAEERRLNLRHKLRRARVLARLFGGGAILLGVGTDDPATPLDPARTARGSLRYAHVLSRWELGHGAKRLDPEDPWFGQPERGEADGQAVEVSSIAAARLVENYLCAKDGTLLVPLREAWNLAVAIMAALIEGYEPKKAEPAAAPASGTAPDEMTASEATAGSTMPEPSPIA